MKKLMYSICTAAIFLASCTQESALEPSSNQERTASKAVIGGTINQDTPTFINGGEKFTENNSIVIDIATESAVGYVLLAQKGGTSSAFMERFRVRKVDNTGSFLFARQLWLHDGYDESPEAICDFDQNNILVAGTETSSNGQRKLMLAKLSKSMLMNDVAPTIIDKDFKVMQMVKTTDGVILAGHYRLPGGLETVEKMGIIKLNNNLQVVISKTYGFGMINDVELLSNGSMLVAGNKNYDGSDPDECDYFYSTVDAQLNMSYAIHTPAELGDALNTKLVDNQITSIEKIGENQYALLGWYGNNWLHNGGSDYRPFVRVITSDCDVLLDNYDMFFDNTIMGKLECSAKVSGSKVVVAGCRSQLPNDAHWVKVLSFEMTPNGLVKKFDAQKYIPTSDTFYGIKAIATFGGNTNTGLFGDNLTYKSSKGHYFYLSSASDQ